LTEEALSLMQQALSREINHEVNHV